jgi:hypothetical protein
MLGGRNGFVRKPLDELSEEEVARLWAAEAERRLKEFRAGRANAALEEAQVLRPPLVHGGDSSCPS